MKTQDELSLKSKPIYLFCDVLPKNAQSYIFFRPILSQKKKRKRIERFLSLNNFGNHLVMITICYIISFPCYIC